MNIQPGDYYTKAKFQLRLVSAVIYTKDITVEQSQSSSSSSGFGIPTTGLIILIVLAVVVGIVACAGALWCRIKAVAASKKSQYARIQ
jgi:hypothetical protein